jgi:hypothetical protein
MSPSTRWVRFTPRQELLKKPSARLFCLGDGSIRQKAIELRLWQRRETYRQTKLCGIAAARNDHRND